MADELNAESCIYSIEANDSNSSTLLTLAQCNICSLPAHLEELELTNMDLWKSHIVGLSETWLHPLNDMIRCIDGYSIL